MSTVKPEVSDWIRSSAVPLKTVAVGAGFEDLRPLERWIGEARVVGLGEANHATSEFFKLKHRLLEFLVSELGFNLFLLEASLPESLAVNRYVLTGEGDARHSLTSLPYWVWNNEEVSEMIEWMRSWNAAHERKVFFYGCDSYAAAPAAMFVLKYLKGHDTKTYHRLRGSLLPLACDADYSDWSRRSAVEKKRACAVVADVRGALNAITTDAPEGRYELGMARLHATVLGHAVELGGLTGAPAFTIRDRCMAEVTAALLELHGPDAKAVLSAENCHLQLRDGPWYPSPAPVGKLLRESFGTDFVMLGTGFDHGTIPYGFDETTPDYVIRSDPGSLDAILAEVGPPIFGLDLRAVPKEVADWFAAGVPLRRLEQLFSTGASTLWTVNVREYFDALLFVRETSSSHLRPHETYQAQCLWQWQDRPAAVGLVNLDFRVGAHHWRMLPQPSVGAYQVAVMANEGAAELEIMRSESLWPWDVYALSQTASAEPWRGKRIVVRCRASVDARHDGSSAQLAIRVRSVNVPALDADREDVWAYVCWQRALTWDRESRELSVAVDIKDDADTIALALVMTGDGRARFGPITIEVV